MSPERYRVDRPKVLYIGGTGRTGSTLLTRLLGEVPGWFAGGELAFLWRHGLVGGGRCSCDLMIADCPVWSDVLHRAEHAVGPIDAQRMVALRRRCWSAHLPLMAVPGIASRLMDRLQEFPGVVEAVYRSLGAVTKSSVIVDSSKEPHYSWILRDRTDLDVYFVQLVRNPRGVAHSWQRRRREHGYGAAAQMERRGALQAAAYYNVSNIAAEAIWSGAGRFRFLRYEDFVDHPAATLEALGSFVGEPIDPSPLTERSFDAAVQHMAWGNPNRFDSGTIEIRSDEAWRSRPRRVGGAAMAAATAPVARRYGYHFASSGVRGQVRSARLRRAALSLPDAGR